MTLVSSDGASWESVPWETPETVHAAMWDGARFLGVRGHYIIESVDGLQWRQLSTEPNAPELSVIRRFSSGYFGLGNGGIYRSFDGVVFSKVLNTTAAFSRDSDVAWNGHTYVVNSNIHLLYSDDGDHWEVAALPFNTIPGNPIWDGVRFVALATNFGSSGLGPALASSVDGRAWSLERRVMPTEQTDIWLFRLRRINGRYFTATGGTVLWSDDAVHWNLPEGETMNAMFDDLAFDGRDFLAATPVGVFLSRDLRSWRRSLAWGWSYEGFASPGAGVAYGNGVFVAGKEGLWRSSDKVTWTQVGESSLRITNIDWVGDRFVALTKDGAVLASVDGASWRRYPSFDGTNTFTEVLRVGTHIILAGRSIVTTEALSSVVATRDLGGSVISGMAAAADGSVVVATTTGGAVLRSTDQGATWASAEAQPARADLGVSWSSGVFCAIGYGTSMRSRDGAHWALDAGAFPEVEWRGGQSKLLAGIGPVRIARGDREGRLWVSVCGDCGGADSLCLSDDRFLLTADWKASSRGSGAGTAVKLTEDTGYFWFFDPRNIEVVTKIVDACVPPFNSFWSFSAGLTNVGVDLYVADTRTGAVQRYSNPEGRLYQTVTDTAAFPLCGEEAVQAEGGVQETEGAESGGDDTGSEPWAPAATGSELLLGQGRFVARAHWSTSAGGAGDGTAVSLTEDAGYFWFFSPANVELVVKVIDACVDPFNSFWFFAAGMTDVTVELTVEDIIAGQSKTYLSVGGRPFETVADTSAFPTCGPH
ncbi:MAG: hypothetical protein IPJ17_04375 [Holophagales bacterium]|nr:MAG: hypothetical protein IPJ17_04375 [Holophagales bacterium]